MFYENLSVLKVITAPFRSLRKHFNEVSPEENCQDIQTIKYYSDDCELCMYMTTNSVDKLCMLIDHFNQGDLANDQEIPLHHPLHISARNIFSLLFVPDKIISNGPKQRIVYSQTDAPDKSITLNYLPNKAQKTRRLCTIHYDSSSQLGIRYIATKSEFK